MKCYEQGDFGTTLYFVDFFTHLFHCMTSIICSSSSILMPYQWMMEADVNLNQDELSRKCGKWKNAEHFQLWNFGFILHKMRHTFFWQICCVALRQKLIKHNMKTLAVQNAAFRTSIPVPCTSIHPCTMYQHPSLYHVPASITVPCTSIHPCTMYQHPSLPPYQ